jgi:2-polyprenyl-3-methyl-5-hydroxy-6-metoxy-1,4-benzoquinol methylase
VSERPPLLCPACRRELGEHGEAFECPECGRRFPLVAGIPDLRLEGVDPGTSLEEDRRQAVELQRRAEHVDLAGLLREHWSSSGKPVELVNRFVAGDLATVGRSRDYLERIERHRGAGLAPGERFLELGCGSGGMSAAGAERGARVVATDVSLRWLVLARKRMREAELDNVTFVCCAAEALPFADSSFDLVAASDVVEHVASAEAFTAACAACLRPGGLLFLATPNRYSLGLEPHVRLWGVGFLPRRLARAYVRLARGTSYDHVRLLSGRAIRNLMRRHQLSVSVEPPEVPRATQALYHGAELALVRAYNRLRRFRIVRRALLAVGPFFQVFATKTPT